MYARVLVSLIVALVSCPVSSSARAQCPDWKPGFKLAGPNDQVAALATLDIGSGPELYALGGFSAVDEMPMKMAAKWDGVSWKPLGDGLRGPYVGLFERWALAAFDDGSGPAVYAGGTFLMSGTAWVNHVARWDGARWSPLGAGTDGPVDALAVYDDGDGPALIAGGGFTTAGGVSAINIARWDGTAWSPLGPGLDGAVSALAVLRNELGAQELYAAGGFTTAGGLPANHVARWNGSTWSAAGRGLPGIVEALAVFDDGSGDRLYAGGDLLRVWDGSHWSALGSGAPTSVTALTVLDRKSGRTLCAAGIDQYVAALGEWTGTDWSVVPFSNPESNIGVPMGIAALASFDSGNEARLIAAPRLMFAPYNVPLYLYQREGSAWGPLGNLDGIVGGVGSSLAFDDGSGPHLFAGGSFGFAGSSPAANIAKYDGTTWRELGEGVTDPVHHWGDLPGVDALAVFDDGHGKTIVAGGDFTLAGGQPASNVAAWDGQDWHPLGEGVLGIRPGIVRALTAFDDGNGSALYAGGSFTATGGRQANHVAKWDGASWRRLGGGTDGTVNALAVFDDGRGARLFAGGAFHTVDGGLDAEGIASWDGSGWSSVGTGPGGDVVALIVFDDGSGLALYAAGNFYSGPIDDGVARWNGSSWSRVGGGSGIEDFEQATTLAAFDDGFGAALFVGRGSGADFLSPGVHRWNGSNWTVIPAPYSGGTAVASLAVYQSALEPAPALFVGMNYEAFTRGSRFSGVGEWRGCGQAGVPFCFGDGSEGLCSCGRYGISHHGCDNSASTGGAVLDASGWTSLAFDSLTLTASGELPSAASIVLQGDVETAPTSYGDGLRCVGGRTKRLFVAQAAAGMFSVPGPGQPSISARSGALGDPLFVGATRLYQVIYRDPVPEAPGTCSLPPGGTWNLTSARRIQWLP